MNPSTKKWKISDKYFSMLFRTASTFRPIYSGGAVALQNTFLATSYDEKVNVTEFPAGNPLASLKLDGEPITALAFSPDLSFLAAATRAFQIHIISTETWQITKSFHKAHESAIMALAVDPTGTLVASGGAEGTAKVWDVRQGFSTHTFKGHGGVLSVLKFYGNAGEADWRLLTGSDDAKVRVFDLVKSKLVKVLENHQNVIRGIDISKDGSWILSGSRDKVFSLWHHYELMATVPVMSEVEACGFFASKYIYAGTPSALKLYNLKGEQVALWDVPNFDEEELMLIDVVKTQNSLVPVLSDQTFVQLDEQLQQARLFAGNHGEIIDAAFSKSGEMVIATNSAEVRILNKDNNFEYRSLIGHTDIVLVIDVLDNWLATAGKDRTVCLWNLRDGECKVTFTGHAGSVGAVALSRTPGLPKFVLSGSEDLTIKKWGPDGNAIYTRKAHDKDINTMDVSADDKYFATGSQDKTIKIWNTETGEVVGILRGHRRGIWNVRFGPNNTLISGSGDKTVRLWDLNTFTCLRTFEGHLNSVLKVLYYNDQNILASAGGDGLVKVWDAKTSECLSTLDNHEDKVWSLTLNKDKKLVSASGDSVITVWEDFTEQQQIEQAEKHQEDVEKQQELENSVRNQQWHRAIELALELNHPLRLLKLFKSVQEQNEQGSITGVVVVDEVLSNLSGKNLIKLFERVRDWNTNATTSLTAQTVLSALLRGHSIEDLKNAKIMPILGGIVAYSQRHLVRLEEMIENTYSLDYALKEMSI